MPEYTVQQGDSLLSIAQSYGLAPDRIWNESQNADLRKRRLEPELLVPGDVVFVSEIRVGQVSGQTEQRHRFVRKGLPAMLRIVLETEEGPRANEPYTLKIEGKLVTGNTGSDGLIEVPLPPDAEHGELQLQNGEEKYTLQFGHLDPVDESTGLQARLQQIGFYKGRIDGNIGPKTLAALNRFQRDQGLEETSEVNDETRDALKEYYGS